MPKILVADDNTNIQKMVALAFEERGIDVISVGNGEAAVRRLPDLQPDMVLADIFMPVRNGYEVCEYVKKDTRFSHIPVILLVGAFDPLDEKEARRVGADGVLKKPFVPPDPLIAMVTSVLEKNPKLAAELAVAKNVAAQAAVPPVPAVIERPAAVAPKPLPQFPEPTPEESALIYGFGSGRRAIEDAKDSAGAAEPPAPVAEADEESAEEFDGAATTRDWRRNAMDFEIPEETSKQAAFISDDSFDSASFTTAVEQVAESAVESAPEPSQIPTSFDPSKAAPESSGSGWRALQRDFLSIRSTDEAAGPARSAAPEMEVTSSPSEKTIKPELEIKEVPILEQAPAQEVTPEPSFASRVRSWMESISPSGMPEGGWFASITSAVSGSEKQKTHAQEPDAVGPAGAEQVATVTSSAVPRASDSTVSEEPVLESSSLPVPAVAEDEAISKSIAEGEQAQPSIPVVASMPSLSSIDDFTEDSFFADEPAVDTFFAEENATDQAEAAPTPQAVETEPEVAADTHATFGDAHSPEQAAEESTPSALPEAESEQPVHSLALESEIAFDFHPEVDTQSSEPLADQSPVIIGFAAGLDSVDESLDVVGSYREPNLVEPPPVHVSADPLLVNEAPVRGSSEYGSRAEELPALHSFLAPPAPELVPEASPTAQSPEEVQAAAPLLSVEITPPAVAIETEPVSASTQESDMHAESVAVVDSQENEERIPTAPPPNRDALKEIPFLSPPREFFASQVEAAKAPASATVDAVVQKVLDRLEPQLRELLSQGLKPLVENILRDEDPDKKQS